MKGLEVLVDDAVLTVVVEGAGVVVVAPCLLSLVTTFTLPGWPFVTKLSPGLTTFFCTK